MVFCEVLCERVVVGDVVVQVCGERDDGIVGDQGAVGVKKICEDQCEEKKVESGEVYFSAAEREHANVPFDNSYKGCVVCAGNETAHVAKSEAGIFRGGREKGKTVRDEGYS